MKVKLVYCDEPLGDASRQAFEEEADVEVTSADTGAVLKTLE